MHFQSETFTDNNFACFANVARVLCKLEGLIEPSGHELCAVWCRQLHRDKPKGNTESLLSFGIFEFVTLDEKWRMYVPCVGL